MSVRNRLVALGAVAAIVPLLMTGCASSTHTTTLADTKGPAQLLRNEVAGRVPTAIVLKLAPSVDSSESCSPDGMMRSWKSSVLMFINPANAKGVTQSLTDLATSLTDQGWTSTGATPSAKIHDVTLKSNSRDSVIRLEAVEASDSKGNGATLEVTVNGDCVQTAGPDSDEVKHLESGS